MYILCPKAVKQYLYSETPYPDAGFLKEFFSNTEKCVVANEVWETMRYVWLFKSSNIKNAKEQMVHFRGFLRPEETIRGSDSEEIIPNTEHNNDILIGKTKELIERNYADIDFFITPDKDKFKDVKNIDKVRIINVEEFFIWCMDEEKYRKIMERYFTKLKYDGYS